MQSPTSDLRIRAMRPLPAPVIFEQAFPLEEAEAVRIFRVRRDISSIMSGADDRLLLVVGPCSIHDPAAAMEFAANLREAADRHAGELLIVIDRKSTRLNSSHLGISYAVF